MKLCINCKIEKEEGEFFLKMIWCKECFNKIKKNYEDLKDRNKIYEQCYDDPFIYDERDGRDGREEYKFSSLVEKERDRHLKKKYNITFRHKNSMIVKQKNKCLICGCEFVVTNNNRGNKGTCVDHNHETGEIRGILCHSCNICVGYYEKIIRLNLLDKVNKYLGIK